MSNNDLLKIAVNATLDAIGDHQDDIVTILDGSKQLLSSYKESDQIPFRTYQFISRELIKSELLIRQLADEIDKAKIDLLQTVSGGIMSPEDQTQGLKFLSDAKTLYKHALLEIDNLLNKLQGLQVYIEGHKEEEKGKFPWGTIMISIGIGIAVNLLTSTVLGLFQGKKKKK